jgi:predicted glycosyltransferase
MVRPGGSMSGRRIWIDFANSPHVLFFAPLIPLLRAQGVELILTARDFAQTVELLRTYGLEAEVIGGHTGRNRIGKALRMGDRALALARYARGRRIERAVSHGSYGQILAARLLGIPAVTLMDYEHQPANHLSFRLARRVIVPFPFPDADLRRCGAPPTRVRRYSGLKEEVYLAGFRRDPGFDAILRSSIEPAPDASWDLDRNILAVLRPPATFALYHGFENALFDKVVTRLSGDATARVLVSPRTEEQKQQILARKDANVRVLARSVRGLDLLARADLVVSAGGTMNREAALLGTPAYTVLAAPLGAVDRWLIDQGRLIQVRTESDLAKISISRSAERKPVMARAGLAEEICALILEPIGAGA